VHSSRRASRVSRLQSLGPWAPAARAPAPGVTQPACDEEWAGNSHQPFRAARATAWGLFATGSAQLCSFAAVFAGRSERACLDPCLQSHVVLRRQGDAFRSPQVVCHMIKFRLSWGLQVCCGSLFLLQHVARYAKHSIFASYAQQFYFLLSFIQQNKSATL